MFRPLLALVLLTAACQAQGNGDAAPSPSAQAAADRSPEPKAIPVQPRETTAPAPNSAEPGTDECGAGKLGRWLNVLPTETVKADIRAAIGHDRIRYIAPGDVVTMDLRPDRLNVETGVDGRIKLFRCG